MKSIIIDAGHGGVDSGATAFGVNEKEWTLKISQYQYKRLKELGAKVDITRKSDISMNPTERLAKVKDQYDVCVSNHWNAFDGNANGVETIHSIHARPAFAKDLAKGIVGATELSFRRVFTRERNKGVDYYFMHRLTGLTETVIVEYGFIDNRGDHNVYQNEEIFYAAAEAVIKAICQKIGVAYRKPDGVEKPAPSARPSKQPEPSPTQSVIGKRVESIHDGQLRFYSKPSWEDKDVFGYLTKGIGFPKILDKITVGNGEQYKVANSLGHIYYVTASPQYVKVVG